ncbi:MAG TPA: hypothetical protein VJ777_25870 [Mycobacterium sp.]|nr:hypothetical protein [Mycobacterium sp.]
MSADERVFWRSHTCCVWVGYDDGGRLLFTGVDREHLDGYEYSIAVAPDQFDKLRRAFDSDAAVDVIDLVCEHVDDVMSRGERAWLDERGIENTYNCQ